MRETQIASKKGKFPQNLVILEALVDLASKAKAKGLGLREQRRLQLKQPQETNGC